MDTTTTPNRPLAASPTPPPPSSGGGRPDPQTTRDRSDTARSTALWLGGTGAFLLLAAASVLVAMQWDSIAAWAKVAGLVSANLGVLWASFRIDRSLPATSRALYGLGGLLVPVSIIAVGLNSELDLTWLVTTASAFSGAALLSLHRTRPMPMLQAVGLAAVVPLAGGFGALTGVAGPVLLAVAALGGAAVLAPLGGTRRYAVIGWSAVAAAAPLLVAFDDPLFDTGRIFTDLGLSPTMNGWVPVAAGGLAAMAFALLAQRETNETLAVASILSLVVGATASVGAFEPGQGGLLVIVAGGMLAVQVAAHATRGRSPWSVTAHLALVIEPLMAVGTAWAVLGGGAATIDDWTRPAEAGAAALLTAAWFVADQRRRIGDCQSLAMALLTGGGHVPGTVGVALGTGAAAALFTGSAITTGLVIGAVVVWLAFAGRAGGHALAPSGAALAIGLTLDTPWTAAVAAVMAVVLAAAAGLRVRRGMLAPAGAWLLVLPALAAGTLAAGRIAEFDSLGSGASFIGWAVFAGLAYLVAILAERWTDDPLAVGVGVVGRSAALLAPIVAISHPAEPGIGGGVLAVALFAVLDAIRIRDTVFLAPLAFSASAGAAAGLFALGLPVDQVGVGLTIIAATAVGLMLTTRGLDTPLAGIAILSGIAGLAHASTTVGALSTSLLILGAIGIMLATDRQNLEGGVLAAGVAIVGWWTRLDLSGVDWSEAYLAPVSLALVAIGFATRRHGVSSWWTYGPAVTLLGGAALAERVVGGSGGHALIAGSVAVVAMVAGADRRLLAPLVTGTVLLVAVTGHESLAYAASVPTWVWLAAGGSALLGAGIYVERSATSPLETGRRAVETIRRAYR